MKKDGSRIRRVEDQLQRELAQLIQRGLKDPRLGMITVTAVEVTKEMEHAIVFVTELGGGRVKVALVIGRARSINQIRQANTGFHRGVVFKADFGNMAKCQAAPYFAPQKASRAIENF